jgi:hypothetical protein
MLAGLIFKISKKIFFSCENTFSRDKESEFDRGLKRFCELENNKNEEDEL